MAWASFLAGMAGGAGDVLALDYRNQLRMQAEEQRNRYMVEREKLLAKVREQAEDRAYALGRKITPAQQSQMRTEQTLEMQRGLMDLGLAETKEQEQQRSLERIGATSAATLGRQKAFAEWEHEKGFRQTVDEKLASDIAKARAKAQAGGKLTDVEKRYNKVWDDVGNKKQRWQILAQTGIAGQVQRLKGGAAELDEFTDMNAKSSFRKGSLEHKIYVLQTGRDPHAGTDSFDPMGRPVVRSKADLDALPSGTEFVDPEGNVRRKP